MARYDPLVNFTAGEISPQLRGRVDVDAYRHAAIEMTNMQPLQYGGARRRFGTEYIRASESNTYRSRLIPFVAGPGLVAFIELSHLTIRSCAVTDGLYEANYSIATAFTGSTPYTEAQLRDIRFAQSANFMVLVHPAHPPRALSMLGGTWWFREIVFRDEPASDRPIYLRASGDITISGTTLTGTAGTFFTNADVGRLISRGTGLGWITAVASATSATVQLISPLAGTSGAWFIHGQPRTVLQFSQTGREGELITITAVSAGFRLGDFFGFIHAHDAVLRIENVTPDGTTLLARVMRPMSASGDVAAYRLQHPTFGWPLGQSTEWVNGYPASVAFNDQRLVFGGLAGDPQRLIGSVAGDVLDFTNTGAPDDGYDWRIEGATNIQHLVSDNDLLALTHADERAVTGRDGQSTITAEGARSKPQSTDGSSSVAPAKVGREHVFVQRNGRAVMALGFDIQIQGYETHDLTLLAEHITRGRIVEMAFARRPVPTLFCVRTDGKMACLTLDSKQRVTAWWLWDGGLAAQIESVACVPLDDYDEVQFVVRRFVNGNWRRGLERWRQNYQVGLSGVNLGFLADCARVYQRSPAGPTGPVTIATHLPLSLVDVVADGMYGGRFSTDADGDLTVPFEFGHLEVGLPYTSRLIPMPPEAPTAAGTGQGRAAWAAQVTVRLHESIGGKINGEPIGKRDSAGMPQPRKLAGDHPHPRDYTTDLVSDDTPPLGAQGWLQNRPLVTIEQDEPLPQHVVLVVQRIQVNP